MDYIENRLLMQSNILLDNIDKKLTSKQIYYISDLHLMHKIEQETDKISCIDNIINNIFTDDLVNSIKSYTDTNILFGGDICSDYNIAKVFYTKFIDKLNTLEKYKVHIYAVLGNHEYWYFNNKEDCIYTYKLLFKSLNIIFLNNNITWLGEYKFPVKPIKDEDGQLLRLEKLSKEENELEYEKQLISFNNMIIVGGTGFAGENTEFNADNGIYNDIINREQEIIETELWRQTYNEAVEIAKENHCVLVILTHNPMSDWNKQFLNNVNCIYINGHTHKNEYYNDFDNNIHVISDNQIGYKNKDIKFKDVFIYNFVNPFINYIDGYHKINTIDYYKFYRYIHERMRGTKSIEKLIDNGAELYLVKHDDYYGFFLVSNKYTYICMGGNTKKIGRYINIEDIDKQFDCIVQKYLEMLSPYRKIQEQISKFIKSFGGSGRIHGTIIDIDFFNHVMLNPFDGQITYYYAPMFGIVQNYDSILQLLDEQNTQLACNYRKLLEIKENSLKINKNNNELIKIDIKNSLYSLSRKLNQLQRLFDKRILRDWDESILSINEGNSHS